MKFPSDLNINSYSSVINWLFKQLPMYQNQGKVAFKKDLNNILKLCSALGNPQEGYKTIHIAGTNGKGTTAHIIAAGLSSTGMKVGLYTSPHYKDYRERIKVDGDLMNKQFVKAFVRNNYEIIRQIAPSFFEITVAMAFQYFMEQKIDVAIIETGLGGRLDSTNIINPIMSVITNISLDHESMLGDTLVQIASEKAGIIKKNSPVLIGERQSEDIDAVFIKKALETQSDLYYAESLIQATSKSNDIDQTYYNISIAGENYNLKSNLNGPFQQNNLRTALAVLEMINTKKLLLNFQWDLSMHLNFTDLVYTKWNYIGRWQILGNHPLIIADSAHNKAGLASVLNALKAISYEQLHIVIGFVNDKTLDGILEYFPKKAKYYFVNAKIPRALSAKELMNKATKFELIGKDYTTVRRGFAAAKKSASKNDVVYLGGSIFVLAEVLN